MKQNNEFYQFENDKESDATKESQPLEMEKSCQSEQPKYVCKTIRLNPGVSTKNFISSQLHYMIMVFFMSSGDALQPLILLDKNYYNLEKSHSGTTLSYILFVQLVLKIMTAIIYGHFNDRFGRKTMLIYGSLSLFTGFLIAPLWKNVFPGFIIAKALTSNGSTALATLPFIADYVHNETKGKANALGVALSTLGAFFANITIKILLLCHVPLGHCYWVIAFIGLTASILNSFGLKEVPRSDEKKIVEPEDTQSFGRNLKEALKEFKTNGWLTIGLFLQILGNADFYIVTTILALYVKSMFPPETDDNVSNIALNNVQSCIFAPAFISNFIYGYAIDKHNKIMHSITFALGGGIIAFTMTFFVGNPYDWKLYVACMLLGGTLTGIYILANFLGSRYYSANKRGIMFGIQTLIGYIGYVIIASGGGFLFDHWTHNAPFVLYTILLSVALILIFMIYFLKIKRSANAQV